MISRRNIRIKVMQNLYALKAWQPTDSTPANEKVQTAQRQVLQHLEQSGRMFIHLLYVLCEVARYADADARRRASKYLPSEEDLHVNTKIVQNSYVLHLLENEGFKACVKEDHLMTRTEGEHIKKIYGSLARLDAYKKYVRIENSNPTEDRKVLMALFSEVVLKDEDFDQYMDDTYMHWADDKEMMKMLILSYLNKPAAFNFRQLISTEKKDYALELSRTVIEKNEVCLDLIKPRLQNWDPERVAIIDMLLLYMGVCEFLYFPSIPPKVTINEYIDMGKIYSTEQSGQFINGVLDNVLKALKKNGKLNKTERARK